MMTRVRCQSPITAVLMVKDVHHGQRDRFRQECALLMDDGMTMTKQLGQYAGRKVTRRLLRTVPWIGGILVRRDRFSGASWNG